MSKQIMVPCISGKCGPKSHIVGSQEQKNCATNKGYQPPAPTLGGTPSLPKANQSVEFSNLRDTVTSQREAAKTWEEQTAPRPEPTGFFKRLRTPKDDPEARRAEADRKYQEGGHDEAVKESFNNYLSSAMKARPSIPGGESVSPMKENGRTHFSDINYVKNNDESIVVTAIGGMGEDISITYSPSQISYRSEFYGRSVPMREGGTYTWRDAKLGVGRHRNEADNRICNRMIELLAHCQNERNWSA